MLNNTNIVSTVVLASLEQEKVVLVREVARRELSPII
jgi:hypothetical protein